MTDPVPRGRVAHPTRHGTTLDHAMGSACDPAFAVRYGEDHDGGYRRRSRTTASAKPSPLVFASDAERSLPTRTTQES